MFRINIKNLIIMIFRSKNGDLVKILRSNFNSYTDYHLCIIQICCGKEAAELNAVYKTQEKNIDIIESIINVKDQ